MTPLLGAFTLFSCPEKPLLSSLTTPTQVSQVRWQLFWSFPQMLLKMAHHFIHFWIPHHTWEHLLPRDTVLKSWGVKFGDRTWNPSTLKVEAEFWGHPVMLTKTPSHKPALSSWEVLVGKGACCPVWHMRGPTLWRVRTDFCIVTSDLQTRTTVQATPNCSPPPHTQISIALN